MIWHCCHTSSTGGHPPHWQCPCSYPKCSCRLVLSSWPSKPSGCLFVIFPVFVRQEKEHRHDGSDRYCVPTHPARSGYTGGLLSGHLSVAGHRLCRRLQCVVCGV